MRNRNNEEDDMLDENICWLHFLWQKIAKKEKTKLTLALVGSSSPFHQDVLISCQFRLSPRKFAFFLMTKNSNFKNKTMTLSRRACHLWKAVSRRENPFLADESSSAENFSQQGILVLRVFLQCQKSNLLRVRGVVDNFVLKDNQHWQTRLPCVDMELGLLPTENPRHSSLRSPEQWAR